MAMPNTKAVEQKKAIKKKRHSEVINVLKQYVDATTHTKRILDLRMNLIVYDLLTLALLIEKQLRIAITEDKNIQFLFNTLESSTLDFQN